MDHVTIIDFVLVFNYSSNSKKKNAGIVHKQDYKWENSSIKFGVRRKGRKLQVLLEGSILHEMGVIQQQTTSTFINVS